MEKVGYGFLGNGIRNDADHAARHTLWSQYLHFDFNTCVSNPSCAHFCFSSLSPKSSVFGQTNFENMRQVFSPANQGFY